ncbi:MAG: hypothetical protein AAFU41_15990 [Pseudomonadota bacterium]
MTINFALSLSFEGIALLQRVQSGWRRLGEVAVDSPTLEADLAALREKGAARAPDGLRTKLIIPPDQIKFTAIDTTQTTEADIATVLEDATPYAISDLVVDFDRAGGRTHIAAVARETLKEAEAFAHGHGFNPVSFVAVPEDFTFQREVFFGPTSMMPTLLGPGGSVAADSLPVMIVGTRVKSRLLILDPVEDETADRLADILDEKLPEAAPEATDEPELPFDAEIAEEDTSPSPVDATQTDEDTEIAAEPDRPAIWIDQIIGEVHAPVVAEVEAAPTIATPAPRRPILPDTPALHVPVLFDPVIAEYRHTPKKVAAPLVALRPRSARRREEAPSPKQRRNLPIIATAAAACIALVGVVAWTELSAPVDESAPVVQATVLSDEPPSVATVAPEQPAATSAGAGLNQRPTETAQTGTVASPLPITSPQDETAPEIALTTPEPPAGPGPTVAVLDIAAPEPLTVTTAGAPALAPFAASTIAASSSVVAQSEADTPLDFVEGPAAQPAPPETVVAAAGPTTRLPTPDEAAAFYEATGVWLRAPRIIEEPTGVILQEFVAPPVSAPVDRAAPPQRLAFEDLTADIPFDSPANPAPPDTTFTLDENGFILATPEGTVTPEGAVVFAGLPDIAITPRPALSQDDLNRMALLAPAPEGVVVIPGPPPAVPPLRPADAALPDPVDDTETAVASAVSEEEALTPGAVGLAGLELQNSGAVALDPATVEGIAVDDLRPQLRPQGLVDSPAEADTDSTPDITSIIAGIQAEDATIRFDNSTSLAVAASLRPDARPSNFGTVVAAARAGIAERQTAAPAPVVAAAPVAPQNFAPVPGGVARAATQEDVIRLREINLIGVYGRPNARRALVRLSNGRFVRVEVGSALDGGQVTAIGDTALNYVKRGRTYAIELPNG